MENKTKSTLNKVLLAVAVVAVVGIGTALVQENIIFNPDTAPDVEFTWTAPTTGSPVHHYVAQVLVNEIDTLYFDNVVGESMMLPVSYGSKYRVRVAGVDASGVQGPMSSWSVAYAPELGPPGF